MMPAAPFVGAGLGIAVLDEPVTWMLVTAGALDSWNTMTASWGGMGVLWDKKICVCFVRPTRYTYEFMEKNPGYKPVGIRPRKK